jgi:hypothetical protein
MYGQRYEIIYKNLFKDMTRYFEAATDALAFSSPRKIHLEIFQYLYKSELQEEALAAGVNTLDLSFCLMALMLPD